MCYLTIITREQSTTQPKESTSYLNFVNAIRSPATKTVYINSLKRYMNYIKVTEVDSLLETTSNNSPKVIESQLIDYIMSLRNDGIAYSTIKYLLAPIFTFYQLNDVSLNKKKVFRYLGEYKRVVKDKAYTTAQDGLIITIIGGFLISVGPEHFMVVYGFTVLLASIVSAFVAHTALSNSILSEKSGMLHTDSHFYNIFYIYSNLAFWYFILGLLIITGSLI
jgi:hypothetical protein